MEIGVLSDTHNLLRPEAIDALAGVSYILHGGDVCRPEVLEALRQLAPVFAVRGNNDRGSWAKALPEELTLEVTGGVLRPVEGLEAPPAGPRIHLVHDVKALTIDPVRAGVGLVVSGHSHRPGRIERDGVVYLNPGNAGQRRFKLPVSLARVRVEGGSIAVELVTLVVG